MKQPILLMSALMLIGCQPKSEVDKCVEAIHKVNEPYKDADERKGVEVQARFHCMKLESGKN
jgi:hypothetical protein